MSWIGVDLDGTLAEQVDDPDEIGPPVPEMLMRVKLWLAGDREVRILTARAFPPGPASAGRRRAVADWCQRVVGRRLAVTCMKDPDMEVLYDDRARQVEANTGRVISDG